MLIRERILVFLILVILIFNNLLLFGETLYFSVSPFDREYGFSFRYNFIFWKFNVDFYAPININISRGFAKFDLRENNIIERFIFDLYPYKVTYDSINSTPFITFINPASKIWNATWLGAGYYGENLFYKNQYLSIIGKDKQFNVTLSFFDLDVFVEKVGDKFNVGLGKGIYVFLGEKSGIGINYYGENILIYAIGFLNSNNELKTAFGLTVKTDNFEMNVGNNEIDFNSIFGNIQWKVGDVYVVGRLQGKKVRLAVEFAVW